MVLVPSPTERDLTRLVSYSIDGWEAMSESVVGAFLAGNVDVFDEPTTLVD